MSSKQYLIEIKEVISQCNELIKQQSQGWAKIVEEIKKVNSSAPSSYIKMQKEVAQSVINAEKAEQQYQKTLQQKQVLEQKILQTERQKIQLAETARRANEAQSKSREKELATEAKLQAQLEKSQNTYNRVQQKVNETTQAYNNLATKKALGIDLNDKEQRTLALLEARLNKYQGVLKGVDANIGKYQRNVGNYASGWNGLSNSINQITREMPAFAVSMNTGFLALSNNIPMLFDEIQRVNNEVKELRAQGKPTESTLTRLASSFFSLQTAMSLGVTLLTIYGADILKWANNAIKGASATSALTQAQEAYNEALKSSEYTKAYSDVTKVTIALEQYKKGVISATEFLQIYNNTLGDTFGKTNDVNKAESLLISNGDNYVKAMLARASANHLLAKSAELNMKILEQQQKGEVSFLEKTTAVLKGVASGTSAGLSPATLALANRGKIIKESTDAIDENRKAIANFYKEFETLSKGMKLGNVFEDLDSTKGKSAETLENERIRRLVDIAKQEQATAEATIKRQIEEAKFADDKDLQYALEQSLALATYKGKEKIAELEIKDAEELKNKKIELAEEFTSEIIKINQAEAKEVDKKYEEDLKDYQKYLDLRLKAKQESLDKEEQALLDAYKKEDDRREKVGDFVKDYATSFSFGDLGFNSLAVLDNLDEFVEAWDRGMLTIEEKTAVVMKAVTAVMSEALGYISQLQQANVDIQLSNLEKEKDVALTYAGDSATGREAIEEQYARKKREIQRNEAIQQKKMAIMQIAMNTATAITSIWAQVPKFDFGVSATTLSLIVGGIGLAQAGIVASTPIPEFWTGTENAPEGLALTQERGAEMITDKNGKIKTLGNSKGSQLTYLNKGDKVYNASDTTDKINEMLMGSGISPIVKVENKGLTKDEMLDVMNKTLARQPKIRPIFDEKGARTYIEKENSRTIKRGNNARI